MEHFVDTLLQVAVRTGQHERCILRVFREDGWSFRLKVKSCNPEHEEIKRISELVPEVGTLLYEVENEAERFGAMLTAADHQIVEVNVNINLTDDGLIEQLQRVMYDINLSHAKARAEHHRNKHLKKKE